MADHAAPDKTSYKPTAKMTATGVAFLPALAVVWLAAQFGIDMPDYVAAGVVAGIMWLAGYLKPEGKHARR